MALFGDSHPSTWEEIYATLFENDWNVTLSRHRSPFAYRGLDDANWQMQTSLMRLGGDYAGVEKHLLRNFRKYAHREVEDRESFWFWLSAAQHHGLPTRLLDWTYSPYVALHFATADTTRMNVDGCIYAVHIDGLHKHLSRKFSAVLAAEGSKVFTVDMLATLETNDPPPDPTSSITVDPNSRRRLIRNLEDFDKTTTNPMALLFEPPSIDQRIVNQYALFSVVSSAKISMDDIRQRHPKVFRKILIPAAVKWQIRDRLDQANITERVMYPGLDGLTRWLARHYGPRK